MVEIRAFGTLDGKTVHEAVLEDGPVRLSILSYGAVTRDWRVGEVPVVLGFDDFDHYPAHSKSFGIIAGRVANRIAHGRFTLGGKDYQLATNDGSHHLHGGDVGLGRRIWDMEADQAANAVRLTYRSPDGEDGYPGAVDFEVVVRLKGNDVVYEMRAMPSCETPINLAQHSYYNLDGRSDVLGHRMWMDADRYTPVDDGLIPTGALDPVAGTRLDFRQMAEVGALDPQRQGIDLNLILNEGRDVKAPAARLEGGSSGLALEMWTDQSGIQVFNAPQMDIPVPGLDGLSYGPFAGICLEAQAWPDALNQSGFPPILTSPDAPYRQDLRVRIR